MARNGLQPVFQDWNSEDNAVFDIQILDPLRRNWKAALQKLLCLVDEERYRPRVQSSEFRNGVLAVSFSRRGRLEFKEIAKRLCKAILSHENESKMSEITRRGVLGISPRSVKFDRLFRQRLSEICSKGRPYRLLNSIGGTPVSQIPPWATSFALGAMTGIPIYMSSCATAQPITPTERDIDAAEKLLKWFIEERGEQEVGASLVRQLDCADRDLDRHIALIAASTRELEVNISQRKIREWRRSIDDQYYLAVNAACKLLLSNEQILEKFLVSDGVDNRPTFRSTLGGLAACLSIGSLETVAAPLTFSNFGGFLTTMAWPTATVVNPMTLAAALGLAAVTLIGHLSDSDARSAASRLKQDLSFISEIHGICRQVDILQSWKRTASRGHSLHLKKLRAMNCPDTVTLWTEFVKEVKRGELEPRFRADSLSTTARDSRGKRAEKQDVEVYMSYLFVARAEEPGSDSENDSSSSD
ncbi:hypothetical protein NHJ13734_006003 [Beauveria thailandica]